MRRGQSGLTLVELLLAVTLIGVVGGMAMTGHIALLRNMMRTESDSMAQADAVYAMEHMYKRLYLANDVQVTTYVTPSIPPVSGTSIVARTDTQNTPSNTSDDEYVQYSWTSDALALSYQDYYTGTPGAATVIARNIAPFLVTYRPATSGFRHMVHLQLGARGPQGEAEEPVIVTTSVLPRGRNNQR